MIDLDDARALRTADPGGMLDAIAALPRDASEAYGRAVRGAGLPSADGVAALVVCGMGGSAVAGDVVRSVFRERLGVPVDVNRSPVLPGYAGARTFVVCCSYSGNTAETLACFREAVARGCRVLALTSGGRLAREAAAQGVPVVPVPGGAQPRAALGHLGFAALGSLEAVGLLPRLEADVHETVRELERLAGELGPEGPATSNRAKSLATAFGGRVPVIWGAEGVGSVAAARWKTQLNENGKVPAFSSSMSELDHNEIVGWTRPWGERFVVVGLRHEGEDPEFAARFPISYDVATDAGARVEEVHASGRSPLARLMTLIVVGDFTSAYLAIARGVDPTPVEVIERLKAALAGRS